MPTGPEIILTLKVLVATVTILFAAALAALAAGNKKLHGRINTVFFALTMVTVLGFELLVALASKPQQVFSREMLLEQVWGYHYKADTRLVNVHVQRLRAKVELDPDTRLPDTDRANNVWPKEPAMTPPKP